MLSFYRIFGQLTILLYPRLISPILLLKISIQLRYVGRRSVSNLHPIDILSNRGTSLHAILVIALLIELIQEAQLLRSVRLVLSSPLLMLWLELELLIGVLMIIINWLICLDGPARMIPFYFGPLSDVLLWISLLVWLRLILIILLCRI